MHALLRAHTQKIVICRPSRQGNHGGVGRHFFYTPYFFYTHIFFTPKMIFPKFPKYAIFLNILILDFVLLHLFLFSMSFCLLFVQNFETATRTCNFGRGRGPPLGSGAMSWLSVTLWVGGTRKMNNAVQKVALGITYGDLAHELTDNEFVADETVKVIATITQKHAL